MAEHVDKGHLAVRVYINGILYMCFPSIKTVEIYRVNQEEITKHTMECEPLGDIDEIELYCLHIEDQHVVVHSNSNANKI